MISTIRSRRRLAALLIAATVQFSCEEVETPRGYFGAKDVTKPTVAVISPEDGAQIRDSLVITFGARDDIGIERALLTVGGLQTDATCRWDGGTQYSCRMDVESVTGRQTYVVNAYDFDGNVGRDSVAVNIRPILTRVNVPGVNYIGFTINSIAASRDSVIWFATDHGLVRYASGSMTLNPPGFTAYRPVLSAMAIDSRGMIWVAYDELYSGGSNRRLLSYDGTGVMTSYPFQGPPTGSPYYSSFAFDQGDTLWGIWKNSGVDGYFTMKNDVWQSTAFPYGTPDVRGLAIDDADRKFFALVSEVRVLEGATWTVYSSANSSLPSGAVTGVMRDHAGRIWASVATGASTIALARYDNGAWTVVNGYPYEATAFTFDRSGDVWMAGGGYLWKYRGSAFLRRHDAEPANAMYFDTRGNLWFGGFYGIYRLNENGL